MIWTKLSGERILGRVCHWLVMKQSSIFIAQKSMFSRILFCASEGFFNILIPTKLGRTELQESNLGEATEIMILSMESRLNSSGTSSQDSQRCSSVIKSMIYWATWDKHQKLSQEEFSLCQCSMTSLVTEKATKMNARQMPESWKYFREDLVLDNGHLLGQVLKRSGILPRTVLKEPGITLRKKCEEMLLEFAESGHRTFRATTPLYRGHLRSKKRGKLSIHFAADDFTIDTIFRMIFSVNQLSVYGAVTALCEEFESHQDRSGEPEILMGQSIVLGEIKPEVPLQNEDSMNHQILWQQYIQRSESLSSESKVRRFCKEAWLMRVVEVGQHLVTKDTGNLRQFRSVACREYTLPRDDPGLEAKRMDSRKHENWACIRSHDQFSTLSFQHLKNGIEIRIWSANQDNSQSGVRISNGTIKYVVDSIQDNTEIPADSQEEQVPQTSIKVFSARSEAKAKPQSRVLVGTTATIPMYERRWIDIEPSKQNLASYDLPKKVINLLRQSNVTSRTRWSNWILPNQILSSKSSFTSTILFWWSLESLFGSRSRFENMSVLLWWFWKNCSPLCSSGTLWT